MSWIAWSLTWQGRGNTIAGVCLTSDLGRFSTDKERAALVLQLRGIADAIERGQL